MTNFNFPEGEILLFDKPYDWTSFDVVGKVRNYIRKYLGVKAIKVGHAGTLDPLADGLLIIMTGRFTKRIEEFQDFEKEYTGTLFLGKTTPSYDLEHEPDEEYPTEHITKELILETTKQFLGETDQVPPVYSAVKHEGRRAYAYARKSQDLTLQARHILISEFEITRIEMPEVDFRVVCSKGTYIRSLARDFGEALGSGAYLQSLRRTRIGEYRLENAWEIPDLDKHLRAKRFGDLEI